MSIFGQNMATATFAPLCCLFICLGNPVIAQPQVKENSSGESMEYEQVRQRLRNYDKLLSGAVWALIHAGDGSAFTNVQKTFVLLDSLTDTNHTTKLIDANVVQTFRDSAGTLLQHKDPAVRGFAAILLGVVGDTVSKSNIAILLANKNGPPPREEDQHLYNSDRSNAALALGLLGAKEYAPRLSELLRSSYASDRTGAAWGLAYMGVKEHSSAIAELLSDSDALVKTASLIALAELDGVEYAKDISSLITPLATSEVVDAACYALARLKAKEQVSALVPLLDHRFRKGTAAKALALLGAKEQIKQIALLLDDSSPITRCDGLIALGILNDDAYAEKMAEHLQDKVPFVRSYAAVALLLMGERTYSKQIAEVVRLEWKLPQMATATFSTSQYFQGRLKLHVVVKDHEQQLTTRVVKEWEEINRSGNGLSPGGKVNRSQNLQPETNQTPSEGGSRR